MHSSLSRLFVFLFIVAGIVTYLKTGADLFEKVQGSVLQIEMKSIDRALQGSFMLTNHYPRNLQTFLRQNMEKQSGEVGYDAYGTEYDYEVKNNGYKIVSAGKNKTFGDDDDVILTRNSRDVELVVANSHIQKVASSASEQSLTADEKSRQEELQTALNNLLSIEKFKAKVPQLNDIELATYLDKFIQSHRLE